MLDETKRYVRMKLNGYGVSARQIDVVMQVLEGKTNEEISHALGKKVKTIKFHLTNVYKVLNLSGRAALIMWCLRGLI